MPKFCSLFSSSSGNSTYIGSAKTNILIDTGVSAKRLSNALMQREIDPKKIDAIFITHEHSDHISGLRVFASNNNIPVYATEGTLSALSENGTLNGKFPFDVMPKDGIEIGDILVKTFETPHDSRESCGYTFSFSDGQKTAVATDIGHITEEIMDSINGSSLLMIESNHDEGMLRNGPYPYYLKRRILSDVGHLSNECCAKVVTELIKKGTTRFYLGHLSGENNFPDLAYQTTLSALLTMGAIPERDFLLEVNMKENQGNIVRF